MAVPDGFEYRNKEMQILKRELQMLCDEEKEMAREKTARQQLVIRWNHTSDNIYSNNMIAELEVVKLLESVLYNLYHSKLALDSDNLQVNHD